MSSEERGNLPFEPAKKARKKSSPSKSAPVAAKKDREQEPSKTQASGSVPEIVSQRMIRRVAFFSGLPTALGMLTFIISYVVAIQHWFKLPNIAVLLVSLGFFGLGVLGLSYGVLSASWDEEIAGSTLGWNEFTMNLGRMRSAWRSKQS